MFATVGGTEVHLYTINNEDDSLMLLKVFVSQDSIEYYYSCCWCSNTDRIPLLGVAGKRGVITIINTLKMSLVNVLVGHGKPINEVRTHSVDDGLILSASDDKSIRLWNVITGVCIAIFAGEKGHSKEVISVDCHLVGNCFISSSMGKISIIIVTTIT